MKNHMVSKYLPTKYLIIKGEKYNSREKRGRLPLNQVIKVDPISNGLINSMGHL